MWTRKELKANAKIAFKRNYWRSVLTALVMVVITGGLGGISANMSADQSVSNGDIVTGTQDIISTPAVGALTGIALGAGIVALIVGIFIVNPLEAGCQKFFITNREEKAEVGLIGSAFSSNYLNVVKTLFLRDLYTILWCCLLIIPGIIKAYSYRMTAFIMAEHPEMDSKEAITLSRQMMDGNKWRAFVLDLSFILWYLLTAITFGIVGIFYVNPYVYSTNAELYAALKNEPTGAAEKDTMDSEEPTSSFSEDKPEWEL